MQHLNKVFIIVIIICFDSCSSRNKQPDRDNVNYIEMGKQYQNFSRMLVGDNEYDSVYKSANDSLILWAEKSLKSYVQNKYDDWQLDSLICFNKEKDKCIMVILFRSTYFNYATLDNINYLNGVKIKEKWYFFEGPSVVFPRERGKPTTFENLHELAIKKILKGYLKKSQEGGWEINDSFFNDLTGGGICFECKTQEDFDKVYLEIVNRNWNIKTEKKSKAKK